MEQYELDTIKQSTENLLSEIDRSMAYLKNYAADVGLDPDNTSVFLMEIKQKIYDYYAVFLTAYEQKKKQIENEKEQGG